MIKKQYKNNFIVIIMKLLLFLAIIPNSLQMTAKYCVNCKYFKSNMVGTGIRDNMATCSFFNIKRVEKISLVTGLKPEPEPEPDIYWYNDEYHCSTARAYETLCGHLGTKYVEK